MTKDTRRGVGRKWRAGHWMAFFLWGVFVAAVAIAVYAATPLNTGFQVAIILGSIVVWLSPLAASDWD